MSLLKQKMDCFLVDRLLPRGLNKDKLLFDAWLKEYNMNRIFIFSIVLIALIIPQIGYSGSPGPLFTVTSDGPIITITPTLRLELKLTPLILQ